MRRPQRHQLDPAARRVYGPQWVLLSEVAELAPSTGPMGLMTIVGLCSDATIEDLNTFGGRLSRPLPGRGVTAAKWLEHHLHMDSTEGELFEVDETLLAWARENQARRLWAVVGLGWGLDVETITASFSTR